MHPSPKPIRVFVVDDEDIIVSTLAMILRLQGGFHAVSFTDPLKALQAAQTEAPDLLISDVIMPQMSGVELAIQLREICPGCKVLLFSGQAATADLLADANAKGYEFELLLKPVHPADLLASIRALTEGPEPASFPDLQPEF
jgi:CheY-like chemotaxis protein